MKYSFTEEAFRKLICSIKDRINNHKHKVADVEDLTELTDEQVDDICEFENSFEDGTIPIATPYTVGCVAVGDGLKVDEKGNVSTDTVPFEGVMAKKKLWTNPNPTSTFATQTISLDLTEYDSVEIRYLGASVWKSNASVVIKKGERGYGNITAGNMGMQSASNTVVYTANRLFTVSDTGVVCTDGYAMTSNGSVVSPESRVCIPLEIYGIKDVTGHLGEIALDTFVADYVVERGGGGIYTWEKYNSGKCVLKAITKANIAYTSGPYLGGYESAVQTFTLPEGLFKTVELNVIGSVRTPNGAILENAIAPNVNSVSLWIINSLKQTTAIETNIKFIVEGTWK
jgi:hypothetical protein